MNINDSYPLLKLREYYYKARLVNLEKSQYWSLAELQNFQLKRLKIIVKYAYQNIKGYREKFDKIKLVPSDIKSLDDIKRLPITKREEIQENEDFVKRDIIYNTLFTGGSTGKSLIYYDNQEATIMRWACHYRGWKYQGYIPSKKLAYIGSAKTINIKNNTLTLNGNLTDKYLKSNIDSILDFRPEYIRGYVGSIYILAKYIIENDININFVKAIDTISENLYDYQKELIEKAFQAPVFEEYCCNDGGACAWECDIHNGLHWAMERAIIENVDGQMIVTDLWNKAMPFIRYNNGDRIKFLKHQCPCGRTLPLIKVKGRDNDTIISPKGSIGATYLMYHGIGYGNANTFRSGIRTIQYVQNMNYQLDVNIVKSHNCNKKQIDDLKKAISHTCQGMRIVFHFIDDIKGTKMGKRQFIINNDKDLLKKWKNQ